MRLKIYYCFLVVTFFISTLYYSSAFARGYPKTITDALSRKVTIEKPVERIAFSGTCIGEALIIAGVWDKVAGRGYMTDPDKILYPGIVEIPVFATDIPGPYNVNYEKMLELNIDLLFTVNTTSPGFEEMNNKIKSRVKIVVLDMFLPETVKSNFEILSAIFDQKQGSKAYIDWYEHIVRDISSKTSGLSAEQKKRFFLNWSFGHVKEFSTMSDKFPGMKATNTLVGGINIAADLGSAWGGAIDPEWLMQQEIDAIICQGSLPNIYGAAVDDPAGLITFRKQIMALPAFASSKAVRNNSVYMISPKFMFSPGLPVYLAYLAKWLHPELFPGLNPQVLHQEYLNRFLHGNFDLSKHGVFVYPK
ncbi:MAG: ABC transporter substrate-binding protein [Desulfobacterales bacterium]|nr:ABC transporter substrate-binding protein [Desulfobacterales bacterium]